MDPIRFQSVMRYDTKLPDFGQREVKSEPMFFSASCEYAHEHGGPITKAFIEALAPEYRNGIFDSRTHMLMAGWYPCIPGWHVDDVPRTRPDGQPDHANPMYKARHAMAWVGAEPRCPTEFITGDVVLRDAPIGVKRSIYGIWNDEIDAMIERNMYAVHRSEGSRIIYFDWQTFHRGSQAQGGGWRWFGRVSIDTTRVVTNEFRSQVQVYMPCHTAGW